MSEPNYITPVGLEKIRAEIEHLQKVERPQIVREVAYAASLGDRSENAEYIYGKKRLREIDRRLHFLIGRLDNVRAIDPGLIRSGAVQFGATVTIAQEDGSERTLKIYGEDEIDTARGVISWRSPIARAVMGKSAGDAVTFEAPGGKREIEILDVRYEAQPKPEPTPER